MARRISRSPAGSLAKFSSSNGGPVADRKSTRTGRRYKRAGELRFHSTRTPFLALSWLSLNSARFIYRARCVEQETPYTSRQSTRRVPKESSKWSGRSAMHPRMSLQVPPSIDERPISFAFSCSLHSRCWARRAATNPRKSHVVGPDRNEESGDVRLRRCSRFSTIQRHREVANPGRRNAISGRSNLTRRTGMTSERPLMTLFPDRSRYLNCHSWAGAGDRWSPGSCDRRCWRGRRNRRYRWRTGWLEHARGASEALRRGHQKRWNFDGCASTQ